MAGSIQKFGFNGATYLVRADAGATEEPPATVEGIATSGATIYKHIKMTENVTGIPLIVNAFEKDILNEAIRKKVEASIFYVDEDGFTHTAKGRITHEGRSTDENLMNVTAIPVDKWEIT